MAEAVEKATEGPEDKKSQSVREWVGLLTGVMLVFLGAAIYAIGRAHRASYLYQLGLDLSQVPEEFYGYLYWGYVNGSILSLVWLGAVALGMFGIAAVSYALRWLGSRFAWVQSCVDWWHQFPQAGPVSSHRKYSAYGVLLLCFGYLVFVTYLLLVQASEAGTKKGQRVLESLAASYEAGSENSTRWIELSFENGQSIRTIGGYRLLCTDKLCSIYDPAPNGGGLRVVPLDGLTDLRVFEKPSVRQALCASTSNGPMDCSSSPPSE